MVLQEKQNVQSAWRHKVHWIAVNIAKQILMLYHAQALIKQISVSTSSKGPGEQMDSYQTPRGWHVVSEKIGDHAEIGTVFVGRKKTGEIFDPHNADMKRDWILTRILRLSGMEEGKNRGGQCDTFQRNVYIHGIPDKSLANAPASKGCIGLSSPDVIALYENISIGTPVCILESNTLGINTTSNIATQVFKQYSLEKIS